MLSISCQLLLFLSLWSPITTQQEKSEFDVAPPEYLEIKWSDLARIDFENKYSEELKQEMPYPIFHESIKKLDGKNVSISGYVIPLEESIERTVIILSAYPFSACFFCGGAGPESVMDVKPKNPFKRLKMDNQITVKGRLQLNSDDLYSLYYILHDAEFVK